MSKLLKMVSSGVHIYSGKNNFNPNVLGGIVKQSPLVPTPPHPHVRKPSYPYGHAFHKFPIINGIFGQIP